MENKDVTATPSRKTEEVEKLAKKKGRVYLCLRCLHSGEREKADVKYRIEAHIVRDHLRTDQVPYYCAVCAFKSTKFLDLNEHMKSKRHAQAAERARVDPDDTTCLKTNEDVYTIGSRDCLMLSKEESIQHWQDLLSKRQPNAERNTESECLARAMQEILPVTEDETEPDRNLTAEVINPAPALQPELIDEVSGLSDHQLRLAMSPLLEQITTFISPAALTRLVNEKEATPVSVRASSAETLNQFNYVKESVRVEDLMPQLLPAEETAITHKRPAEVSNNIIPNKKMRSRSPSPVSSESSFEEDKEEKEELKEIMKSMLGEFRRNTCALESLQRSIHLLTAAVTAQTSDNKSRRIEKGRETEGPRPERRDERRRTSPARKPLGDRENRRREEPRARDYKHRH